MRAFWIVSCCLLGGLTVGCGGHGGGGSGGTFTGSYSGSYYATSGSMGPMTLTVTSGGVMSGTATNTDNYGAQSTLSGILAFNTGAATLQSQDASGTVVNNGSFYFNGAGQLVGSFTNSAGTTTTVNMSQTGQSSVYVGTYSGTYTTTTGGSGTVSITVSSLGEFAGNMNDSVTLAGTGVTGTISQSGALAVTLNAQGVQTPSNGAAAFNQSGQLIVLITTPSGYVTDKLTLKHS